MTEAQLSYQMLSDAAPQKSVDVWNVSILEAEAACLKSPKAMDIMHSKIKTAQSLKEIMSQM